MSRPSLQKVAVPVVMLLTGLVLALPSTLLAQSSRANHRGANLDHYLFDSTMPPGMIAHRKSLARQASFGYLQPVKLVVPAGAQVEIFSEGAFQASGQASTVAGLMVGHIYRLKITDIPGRPGVEVFPSIEMLSRLFPPQGEEARCAIPVHIPMEDLEPASDGLLVTRVVYLENPRNAFAEQQRPGHQPFFDVGFGEDPIRAAEKLGRPMVIVRTGSRIPDQQELDGFGFGTPPIRWFDGAELQEPNNGAGETIKEFERQNAPSIPSDDATGSNTQSRNSRIKQVAAWQTDQPPSAKTVPTAPQVEVAAYSIGDTQDAYSPTPAVQCPPAMPGELLIPQYQSGPLPPFLDEVLVDGGDRGLKAIVRDKGDRWHVEGLDSEDTIGHFDTLDGRRIVDSSNRVEIYAPRFAAVRQISRLGRTQYNTLTRDLEDKMTVDKHRHRDFSSTTLQNLQPQRNRQASAPRSFEDMNRGVAADNTTQIRGFDNHLKSYENFRLMKTGYFDNKEKGRLAIAMDRANVWQSKLSAQSTIKSLKLWIVDDVRKAQETIHVKTQYNRSQLRLVKIASQAVAKPGDVIEFTIRFDNVGGETIGNVTILDNLTTRLVFVEESAECSVAANFSATENSSQSQILKWEIIDPLAVGKGGIIRFKCRVR